jgi:hypothetical protein
MEPVHLEYPARGLASIAGADMGSLSIGRRLGKENNMESQYLMWFLIAFIFIVVIL